MGIVDLQRRLRTVGKIRMGGRGEKGQPKRLLEWRMTSADARALAVASSIYGGEVRQWEDPKHEGQYELYTDTSELRVVLAREVEPSQWYEEWSAGGCQHRCDGVNDQITGGACTCDPEQRKCQLTTRVSVYLPELPELGVWLLESHGWYAATELMGSVEMVLALEREHNQRLPMIVAIEPRVTVKEGQTRRYVVPVLRVPGSLASLLSEQSPLALSEMASRAGLDGNPSATIGGATAHAALPAAPEAPPQPSQLPPAHAAPPDHAQEAPKSNGNGARDVAGLWTGPGQCPSCHAPEGKPHAKKCKHREAAAVAACAPQTPGETPLTGNNQRADGTLAQFGDADYDNVPLPGTAVVDEFDPFEDP